MRLEGLEDSLLALEVRIEDIGLLLSTLEAGVEAGVDAPSPSVLVERVGGRMDILFMARASEDVELVVLPAMRYIKSRAGDNNAGDILD